MAHKEIWEKYGENEAHFVVSTFDKFKSDNLADENVTDFFQSGENYVKEIWRELKIHFDDDFYPQNALDFGCGIARITIPLSKKCLRITGVDVSSSMIAKAQENAESFGIENAEFRETNEDISDLNEKFDFVHSFIVIQHINPQIGYEVFNKLTSSLEENGIGVIQITYENPSPLKSKIALNVFRKFPFIYKVKSKIQGQNADILLPMYNYDLNKIFSILQQNNCHKSYIRFTNHGYNGILIFFQKKSDIFDS